MPFSDTQWKFLDFHSQSIAHKANGILYIIFYNFVLFRTHCSCNLPAGVCNFPQIILLALQENVSLKLSCLRSSTIQEKPGWQYARLNDMRILLHFQDHFQQNGKTGHNINVANPKTGT